nr:sulfite exporter TauE/SafE family protein [uncultured Psychroserpens sp.]
MDITQILGYFGALVIGIVLGLTGGGGSILTVPVFVYLMFLNPITATAYSLFVVGVSATFGAFQNIKKGLVDFKTAIIFAIPALIAVYLTRRFLIPIIPSEIVTIGNFTLTKNMGIMVFFAIIMLLASITMIREKENCDSIISKPVKFNYPLILIEGIIVGVLTGIVGAGGGFLIIPALVLLAKLPMKKAIATSLLIIAVKSLIGFIGDVQNFEIDWGFLLLFTLISVIGIFIGTYLSTLIDGKKLKKGFGWFVLVMGIYIILKELI